MSDKTETGPNAWFFRCIKEGIVGADEESWARDQLASWLGQYDGYNGLEDVAWIVMKAVREALEKAAGEALEHCDCMGNEAWTNVIGDHQQWCSGRSACAAIRALGAACEHEPEEKMSATICRKCQIVLREK